MDKEKSIVIWGAGKIGRGFIADLANNDGYRITFIDMDKELINKLKEKKQYSVYRLQSEKQSESAVINGFEALHTSETKRIQESIDNTALMALVVFPDAFDEVGVSLAKLITARAQKNTDAPLNILVCTNITHPADRLRESIIRNMDESGRTYFDEKIGLAECLVIRMAVQPGQKLIDKDELVVATNGYPELIADRTAFKGDPPQMSGLVFTDNIIAEEQRKMFTYNMVHALYSYIGITRGYEYVYECTRDDEINRIAGYALDEIGQGLMKEFGFSEENMSQWNRRVLKNMSNPVLKDKLVRVGGDPVRKLKRQDRLTGAALLCRKNGIMPYYLSMAIAYGYLYNHPEDEASVAINQYIKKYGLKAAVVEFSQLGREPDMVKMIFDHYQNALEGKPLLQNPGRVEIVKRAYTYGFQNEKKYKGCGQCTLLALFELFGEEDPDLFKAASGLSGGMALCNDGVCGGYNGGVLFMSKLVGRRLEQMRIDGDKEDQYRSFSMAQKLHDRFVDTYGSVICKDIHQCIFGEWFCLREGDAKNRFEAAGAHADKCTCVIAVSSAWIAEILIEEGFIKA